MKTNKELLNVSFILENCEVLCFEREDIIRLEIGETIKTCGLFYGTWCEYEYVRELQCAIDKDAKPADPGSMVWSDRTQLTRDVTSIMLHYSDGSSTQYTLDWCIDKYEPYCEHQKVLKTPEGHQVFIHSSPKHLCPMDLDQIDAGRELANRFNR